jgi:hypothetical protein
MLSVVTLSVIMPCVIILIVIMLSVAMPSVVMLIVAMPNGGIWFNLKTRCITSEKLSVINVIKLFFLKTS